MFVRHLLFISSLLCWWGISVAQITGPEQDCENALPVCGEVFTQNQSYQGPGAISEMDNVSNCLTNGENNAVWYIFTVTTGGVLEFLITPNGMDDYDFVVFDITGLSCNDIQTVDSLAVRCNFAQSFGQPTGLQTGATATSAAPNGNPLLAPLNVSTGETFALLIDNFSSSDDGYTIDFSASTSEIVDTLPPGVNQVVSQGDCEPSDTLIMTFTEPILCNTIASDGSDFNITGASTPTIIGAQSVDCISGSFTQIVQIIVDQPIITGGNYTMSIQQGSDGNTVTDNCGNEALQQGYPFIIPDIVIADYTFDVNTSCVADTVEFTSDVTGNVTSYFWDFDDGTTDNTPNPTHIYTDTGTYNVMFVATTADCADTVYRDVEASQRFESGFTWSPATLCPGATVNFSDTSTASGTAFFWDFGDGNISNQQNPTHSYTSDGTYDVTFVVIDPVLNCTDTTESTLTVRPLIAAGMTIDNNPVCQGTVAQFSSQTNASPASYSWDFGNGDTSSNPNPAYTYTNVSTYEVYLTVVDSFCGQDTDTLTVDVLLTPTFDLGEDTSICFSEEYLVTGPSNVDSYNWSTGDTSQNIVVSEVPDIFSLEVDLAGCTASDSVFIDEKIEGCAGFVVPTAFSPNGDNLNDRFNIITKRMATYTVKVYSRWGQLVYEADQDTPLGWDGTYKDNDMEIGTYVFHVKGTGLNGRLYEETGNLTLIR